MTGTNCDLFTHNQSRLYLNHLVNFQEFRNDCKQHTKLSKRLESRLVQFQNYVFTVRGIGYKPQIYIKVKIILMFLT